MVSTVLVNSHIHNVQSPFSDWDLIENMTLSETNSNWETGESWGRGNGWGWSHDGLKFITGTNTNDQYYSFDLSTPFDVSTSSGPFSGTSSGTVPGGIWFSDDGLLMATLEFSGNTLEFWDITVPWRPTNATRSSRGTFSVIPDGGDDTYAVHVSRDGIHLFIITRSAAPDNILHYKMSTPWDPTTLVRQIDEFSKPESATSQGYLHVSGDGRNMLSSMTTDAGIVKQYSMTVPWDVSTIVEVSSLDVSDDVGNGGCLIYFTDDGTKMICGRHNSSNNYDIVVYEV